MKTIITCIIRAIALPVMMLGMAPAAQANEPTAEPALSDYEPAQLKAAQTAVDAIWPLGTYRRIVTDTMREMAVAMFDMPMPEFDGEESPGGTLGEQLEAKDPHGRERFTIMMRVMSQEMLPIMDRTEPAIRENLALVFADRFTLQELNDMNQFFATPSGQAYARESMTVLTDPKMMQAMQQFMPEFLQAMPGIMKRFEEETAHLPPAPTPEGTPETQDDSEEN